MMGSSTFSGTVSIIGVYGPPWNLIPLGTAMNKALTLRMGQCNVRRYMPHLLEHIRQGHVDARGIISHRIALEDVREGYELFARKADDCRKVVMYPHGLRAAA